MAFGIESQARLAISGTPGRNLRPVGVGPAVVLTLTGSTGSAVPEVGVPEVATPVEGEIIGAEVGAGVEVDGGDTGNLPEGTSVSGIGAVLPASAIQVLSARRSSSMLIP